MDIRDFLRARWAEERADALAAQAVDPVPWRAEATDDGPGPDFRNVLGGGVVIAADEIPLWDCEGSHMLCMTAPTTRHVARWHPGHVLADLAAKERLLAEAEGLRETASLTEAWFLLDTADTFERHLVAPYAAHPDYEEGWKP